MTSKNLIFSVMVFPTLALVSCGQPPVVQTQDPSAIKNVSVSQATKDYFMENIILPGKVSSTTETVISSQASGTVKTINIDAGQSVKAGQILATLDLSNSTIGTSAKTAQTGYDNALSTLTLTTESVKKDLESAQIQLTNAKVARDNTYITTDKQLSIAQTQLANIKTSQINTTSSTEEATKEAKISVDLAQESLDNAKTTLDNFEKNSEENLSSLYENIRVNLGSALVDADAGITQADLILGMTDKNKTANDTFQIFLGAKDSSTKSASEASFGEVQKAYMLVGPTNTADRPTLENSLDSVLDLLQKELNLYDNLVQMMNNSISSSSFPQTQLDGLSLAISKNQATLLQTQATLTNLKNSLATTKTSIDTNDTALKNGVSIAESQLANANQGLISLTSNNKSTLDTLAGNASLTQTQFENTIAIVNSTRENADNAVKIAQAQYDSAKAKLSAQLVGTKSQADIAKGSKDMANIQLANTQIIAPFDGVILSKNIEVGQLINPGMPVFSIGNTSSFKVKLDVNGDQIGYFLSGSSFQVKKQDLTFTGTVSAASPGADSQTKLFHVELLLSGSGGQTTNVSDSLHSGDYVDVMIEKKTQDTKVISIPFAALVAFDQGRYGIYTIGSGSTAILRYVTIGAQNSNRVEILSGLNEGETYISNGVLTLTDGDKVNVVK